MDYPAPIIQLEFNSNQRWLRLLGVMLLYSEFALVRILRAQKDGHHLRLKRNDKRTNDAFILLYGLRSQSSIIKYGRNSGAKDGIGGTAGSTVESVYRYIL